MNPDAATLSYSVALTHAVQQRNVKLAKELLEAGANVNRKSKLRDPDEDDEWNHYFRPIFVAVANDDLGMVKLLLQYNPNVNDRDTNFGQLPLVRAARKGRLEIVKTLLAHPGIVVNARDADNYSALEAASEEGIDDVADLLLKHGDNSNDECSEALGQASYSGYAAVMRLLLEQGADANYLGSEIFHPPLYEALDNVHLDAVRLLLRSGGAISEIPFQRMVSFNGQAMRWLSEDTTRTILGLNALPQRDENWSLTHNWDGIAASLWFYYYGPNRKGAPPRIRDTTGRPDKEFKVAFKWMIHAVSSLLYLEQGNILLPHLCRVFDPSVALELCEHTGKTPLHLALEMFPRRDETELEYAASGIDALIEWNPDGLKVAHPETHRIPMTCAIVNQAPLQTLQTMVSCKNETWFTASPLQQDPVTLLPNILLVAAGKGSYSEADIYAFSRNYFPDMISSLMSPRVLRRGIKRSREQI